MRFQLLGGNPEDEIPVPWPPNTPLPPFLCVGEREPFHHYVRLQEGWPLMVFVGPCRQFVKQHRGAYPHQHEPGEL
jgi:hypothetical protein